MLKVRPLGIPETMICQVIGILGLDLSKRTTSALSVVVLAIWLLDVAAFKTNPTFFLRATWSDSEFESSLDLNEDTLVFVVLVVLDESFEDDDSDVNLLTFTLGYFLLPGLCLLY